jgi:hypothetical protein
MTALEKENTALAKAMEIERDYQRYKWFDNNRNPYTRLNNPYVPDDDATVRQKALDSLAKKQADKDLELRLEGQIWDTRRSKAQEWWRNKSRGGPTPQKQTDDVQKTIRKTRTPRREGGYRKSRRSRTPKRVQKRKQTRRHRHRR